MLKLALIGKDIQHSLSPAIYHKYLGDSLKYDLLDFENEEIIPSPSDLLAEYNGVSITSPFKKCFINKVKLTANAESLGAINCLGIIDGEIVGENTDYLAILDILINFKKQYEDLFVVVLGDGVMSKVTIVALMKLKIPFKVLSRKMVDDFTHVNLSESIDKSGTFNSQKLIINTCSRDFIFQGEIDSHAIFWDYNYKFDLHARVLSPKIKQYCDGEAMLELQARYALAFWSLKTF